MGHTIVPCRAKGPYIGNTMEVKGLAGPPSFPDPHVPSEPRKLSRRLGRSTFHTMPISTAYVVLTSGNGP